MIHPAFVYVLHDSFDGWTKIGMSKAPERRMAELSRKMRRELKLVMKLEHHDAHVVELAAIAELRRYLVHETEWLKVSPAVAKNAVRRAAGILKVGRKKGRKKEERHHLGIRFPLDLLRELDDLARADCRTPSDYARVVLTDHIKSKRGRSK